MDQIADRASGFSDSASCAAPSARGWSPRKKALLSAIPIALVLLLSVLLQSPPKGPILCLWRNLTGMPCPSCGMTRGFVSMGHGDLAGAFRYNLAAPFAYLAAIAVLALCLLQAAANGDLLSKLWTRCRKPALVFALALMAIAWARNLIIHFERIP